MITIPSFRPSSQVLRFLVFSYPPLYNPPKSKKTTLLLYSFPGAFTIQVSGECSQQIVVGLFFFRLTVLYFQNSCISSINPETIGLFSSTNHRDPGRGEISVFVERRHQGTNKLEIGILGSKGHQKHEVRKSMCPLKEVLGG